MYTFIFKSRYSTVTMNPLVFVKYGLVTLSRWLAGSLMLANDVAQLAVFL